MKKVTFGLGSLVVPLVVRNGEARRFQTASALKGNMNSMEEPANRGVMTALTVPWMW